MTDDVTHAPRGDAPDAVNDTDDPTPDSVTDHAPGDAPDRGTDGAPEGGLTGTPLALVHEACHAPFRAALDKIQTRLESGLVGAVEKARRIHDDLVAESGLNTDAPEEWPDRTERLLEYRRRVSSEILGPLRAVFRGAGPGASTIAELEKARVEARERARALPAAVEDEWPADALTRHADDDFGRRARKLLARAFSPARKAGAPRSVPVRSVALHHLDEALAPRIDATAAGLLRDWAAWERDIETALIEWGEVALPALVRSELPDDPEAGEESRDADWVTVREAGLALGSRLRSLEESCPLRDLVDGIRGEMAGALDTLEADLAVAGSFAFRPRDTHRIEPSLPLLEAMEPVLREWDACVANRIHLYDALLAILAGATAVQHRLVYRVREKHLADTVVLERVASTLEDLASGLPAEATSRGALSARLDRLHGDVQRALAPAESAVPVPSELASALRQRSDATVDALLSMIRQAPASLDLHAEDGRLPRRGREVETRSLALQELARQAFDALRIERIRSSTDGLVDAIQAAKDDVAELPEVFAFAFEAAKKELDEDEDGARQRATGLVEEALLSMAESLRNAERRLDAAVRRARSRLATEVSDGSLGLLDRIAAGRVQARLLAARSSLAELRAWVTDRWGPPVASARRALTARWKLARRLASRGLRKGTEIVGTGPAAGGASVRTLKTLSDPRVFLGELPLVYQRLFTLEAIDDPSLLAARDGELADAMSRWRRWRSRDGVPLIVKGRPGSGITSFLNVLGSRISQDGGELDKASLDGRIDDEEALARRLAEVLGLEAVESLEELSAAIFDAPRGAILDAVVLDNLEHLYMRVPGGTDIVERLLTLMAETDPRVFWIGGITASAWQLISMAEPTAVSQVEVLELGELTGAGIREAITRRHRRSGLPLRYQEPDSSRRMLSRRLKRLSDRRGYDDLLAENFFTRLERTSSRHLRLALFQWLRAADFDQGEGVVVREPERPDFSVLDALTLTQNFTLKAFLEHRTLTLAEHDRIFRLPRQESYQIFESLQNRHLIEPVTSNGAPAPEGGLPSRSEIEEDLRYGVRPLLVGAVISHLQGRNIFH